MKEVLHSLIGSKMRIKILLRLFLNPEGSAYLRELAGEFQASPSQVKAELDQLKQADLLIVRKRGRQVLFSANTSHPVFSELHSMVKKTLGMDKILESIIERLGNLELALLVGDYAEGKDTGIIDLVLIGDIDTDTLADLTRKTERYIDRKIRSLVLTTEEYRRLSHNLLQPPCFKLWENDK